MLLLLSAGSVCQAPLTAEAGQAEANSQVRSPSFFPEWQELRYLGYHLGLLRVLLNQNLVRSRVARTDTGIPIWNEGVPRDILSHCVIMPALDVHSFVSNQTYLLIICP